jgi:hypothetical protein
MICSMRWNRGAQAPTVQPFDPKESFNLTLEIDATDDLEDEKPVAKEEREGKGRRVASKDSKNRSRLASNGNLALEARVPLRRVPSCLPASRRAAKTRHC